MIKNTTPELLNLLDQCASKFFPRPAFKFHTELSIENMGHVMRATHMPSRASVDAKLDLAAAHGVYDIRELVEHQIKNMFAQLEYYVAKNHPETMGPHPLPTDDSGSPVSSEVSALLKLLGMQIAGWNTQHGAHHWFIVKKSEWCVHIPNNFLYEPLTAWQTFLSRHMRNFNANAKA